jgi:hypothetical protein
MENEGSKGGLGTQLYSEYRIRFTLEEPAADLLAHVEGRGQCYSYLG